jgi:N-acetylneuraminate synthase/N,N'-diacetyllegionaminate synthase
MRIGEREIGPNHPVYIIAELGVNHDGSPERAMQLVDAAHQAGADAIKLQYFETDRLMSKSAKLAAYQKAAGETDPIAMLRRLELRLEDMGPIVDRAHALGMHAIVTVFSTELVDLAERLPWDAYKTASPDIVHRPLLERLMATGKPLIVSTGASTMDEVTRAVGWLQAAHDRLAVLQCVSCYPTNTEDVSLDAIEELSLAFPHLPIGYSDHAINNSIGPVAVTIGACILERHLTYSNDAQGPDHAASSEPDVFGRYALIAKGMHKLPNAIKGEREPKRVRDCERDVRTVSRQSIVALRSLPAGRTIAATDLTIKRPGTGFLPFELDQVIGRRTAKAIDADTVVRPEDLA